MANIDLYAPALVLRACSKPDESQLYSPDEESYTKVTSMADLFKAFLNKLGHICDCKKGGDTVTAIVVLQPVDHTTSFRFVFARNRNGEGIPELQDTVAYMEQLFGIMNRRSTKTHTVSSTQHVRRRLLAHVLVFNRPRLCVYAKKLRKYLDACLEQLKQSASM